MQVNQVVMAKHFQYLGCNFDVAVNGEEGISFAVSTAYDLILMDVQMPIKVREPTCCSFAFSLHVNMHQFSIGWCGSNKGPEREGSEHTNHRTNSWEYSGSKRCLHGSRYEWLLG